MTTFASVSDLLSSASRWTTGAFGRDAKGNGCDPVHGLPGAVCYCVEGALLTVYPDKRARAAATERVKVAAGLPPHAGLAIWNDHSNHAIVLAAVQKAGV